MFIEFNEFDGGDGQMGVAGDGQKGLEKMDNVPMMGSSVLKSLDKSKMMSAKNAWGTSTGYAEELLSKNPKMDTSRAQQLENWQNQQEVRRKTQQQQEMAEQYGQANWDEEENWRSLAKFGVERNQVSSRHVLRGMCDSYAYFPVSLRSLASLIMNNRMRTQILSSVYYHYHHKLIFIL